MQKAVQRNIFQYLFIIIISIIFSALCFYRINPVDPDRVDLDASCFFVIGRAMLKGKMPYIDFVDNKGPITYLLYALSAIFGKFPWGVLITSSLLVLLSLIVLKKICDHLDINTIFAIFLYLFFYVCICTAGGFTEDMSLPLTLSAFLCFLKIEKNILIKKSCVIYELLMGILFWACALTRINNAVSIGVIVASMGIYLLIKGEYKHFLTYILNFIVGSAFVVLPILIWLNSAGALNEFLCQFLLNNFKYSGAKTAMTKDQLFFSVFGFKLLLLTTIGIYGAIVYKFKNKNQDSLVFVTIIISNVITAFSFISMTQPYDHYMLVIFIPSFLGFLLQFSRSKDSASNSKKKKIKINNIITVVLCLCVLTTSTGGAGLTKNLVYSVIERNPIGESTLDGVEFNIQKTFDDFEQYVSKIHTGTLLEDSPNEKEIKKFVSHIPEEERNSVFAINVMPSFYAFSGIIPCKRIFVCQDLFTDISTEYRDEFISYFEKDPPRWLVTAIPLEKISLCNLGLTLKEKYNHIETDTEIFYLYELGRG